MSGFKKDGMDTVAVRLRSLSGRSTLSCTILSYPQGSLSPFPAYEVEVSDGTRSYRVVGLPGFEEAERVARDASQPNDPTHGSVVRFATRQSHVDGRWRDEDFLRPLSSSGGASVARVGAYYRLHDYGRSPPLDVPHDPSLRAVGIDVTDAWPASVTSALGRIRTVYALDPGSRRTDAGERGDCYDARFVRNVAEALQGDGASDALAAAGYADLAAFETVPRGEGSLRLPSEAVDACDLDAEILLDDLSVDRVALCGDPVERARTVAAALEAAGAGGLASPFDDPFRDAATPAP